MKHSVESLKRNFTLAELWALEKELKQKLATLQDLKSYGNYETRKEERIIIEILGKSNKKES